jgi:hypothetical protein
MNFPGTKPYGKHILFSISYSTASGCCFSLVSYLKDRKKQQFTFKKDVNNKSKTGEIHIRELSRMNLTE